MPLKRSEFGKWEVTETDPDIVVKHQETGVTLALTDDGELILDSVTLK